MIFRRRVTPVDPAAAIVQKVLDIEQGRGEAQERLVKEMLLHQQRSLEAVLAFQERIQMQRGPDVNDKAVMEWLERRFDQLEEKMLGALADRVAALAEEMRAGLRDPAVVSGVDAISRSQRSQLPIRQPPEEMISTDYPLARHLSPSPSSASAYTPGLQKEMQGHDKVSEMEKQLSAKVAAPWAAAAAGKHDPRALAYRLREEQMSPWLDVDQLGFGHPLIDSLVDAIRDEAGVVVAHISDEYAASANCRKEFQFAKKMGLKIVPVIVGYTDEQREVIAAKFDRTGGMFANRKPTRPWEQTWLGMEVAEDLYIDARFTDNLHELYGNIIKTVKAELDSRRRAAQIATAPSNTIKDIFDAVSSNNLEAVKRLLQSEPVLTMKSGDNRSVLHIAVQRSTLRIVQEVVLACPALIMALDGKGNTPLFEAVELEKKDIVKYLLAEGADVKARNLNKQTPLHLAANLKSSDVASMLLDAKPDLDAVDLRHETPLLIAAKQDGHRVMAELLRRGADVNTSDDDGITPIILACQKGDDKMFGLLLGSKASLKHTTTDGATPLISCCASLICSRTMVEKILEHTPGTIDVADNAGMTAIFHSVQTSNVEVFELLRTKAKIDILTRRNWNLLHVASGQSDSMLAAKVYDLLKPSPSFSIDAVTQGKMTALRVAAWYGHIDTVKLLLANGADPLLPDCYNVDPFMAALNADSVDAVKLLLEAIALRPRSQQHDIHLANDEARGALVLYARARGSDRSARWLADHFGIPLSDASSMIPRPSDPACARRPILNPLHAASRSGNLPMISSLLAAGYHVDSVDANGNTALCRAVFCAHAGAVSALLEAGADAALRNHDGDTAVLHAAGLADHDGAIKVMRALIAGGADLNVKGNRGRTALHAACVTGNVELVKLLVEKKVDVGARDKDGKLPVDLINDQCSTGKATKAWLNGLAC
ncbi:hypothetical protein HK101_000815 [Irineochytrium annulatum]|nr:hypothetical protein HK101_000815 [Irineochytrium annulatum]